MQRLLSYILGFIAVTAIGSCKKGDIVSDYKSLGIGSYVTLVKSNNTIIDYANLSTSKISITVKEYGSPVDKIKVYVTKGNATLDRSKWKLIKEFPYSGETLLEVKATEVATALGIPPSALETGATYTMYNQIITKDGRSFDVANTYSDFAGNSNYNMALIWAAVVVCPYNATGFGGDFEVVEDGWADYSVGDIVKVVVGPGANEITFPAIYLTNPARPVVVKINPATGAATMASQDYGDYPAYGITNIKAKTVGTNNWVFSCVGTISLKLNHSSSAGNFGDATLRLKKL